MASNKAFNFSKQPGNPYHTGTYGFFGPNSFTSLITFRSIGPHPGFGRIFSVKPSSDYDIAMRWTPHPGLGEVFVYTGAAWQYFDPAPQEPAGIDMYPAPTLPSGNPKTSDFPAYNIFAVRYNAPSTPGRWTGWHKRNSGGTGVGVSCVEPTPSTQPRAPSNRWGVMGSSPGSTSCTQTINGYFSEAIFMGKAQPGGNVNELTEGILQYYNSLELGPPFQGDLFWEI